MSITITFTNELRRELDATLGKGVANVEEGSGICEGFIDGTRLWNSAWETR